MPLTAEQAYEQLSAELKARGGFNIGNALDSFIGVASANTSELQSLLNDLMTKKGILSEQDEIVIQSLMERQEQEKRKRQKIRTKNALLLTTVAIVTAGIIYLAVKKKKN